MKRIFAVLLAAALLLTGCGVQVKIADPSALTETTVLFYPQDAFAAREGTLLTLEEVADAWSETLFPRTHIYDELFPGDGVLLLQLLDYCFANGYQGFSVLPSVLKAEPLTPQQRQAMEFMYRIDGGKVLALDNDPDVEGAACTTFWYKCSRSREDTMKMFAEGLAAAREIAAQLPTGGNDYETALAVFNYLAEHVKYGDKDSYYFNFGHHLYDALIGGVCICSGYSDAMYYLCNLCGVECLGVYGLAASDIDGGLEDHAWNMILLDGSWYCCDPTWNADMDMDLPIFFAVSEHALQMLGRHTPTGEYTDTPLIPSCEDCFDPVAVWNGTVEGALQSWLWYAGYAQNFPAYLLLALGLPLEALEQPDASGYAKCNVAYAAFLERTEDFMTADCFLSLLAPDRFCEIDGLLAANMAAAWSAPVYHLASVSVPNNGVYTAALETADGTTAQAEFTVEQVGGLYRIVTITFTP